MSRQDYTKLASPDTISKTIAALESRGVAGAPGSAISKLVIFEKEPGFTKRQARVIFAGEKLGF